MVLQSLKCEHFADVIDACESNPCDINAVCENTEESLFSCSCNDGFSGDGFICESKVCIIVSELNSLPDT